MTYYEVLGVSENASSAQIRDAYRKLVKQYHPDRNPSAEALLLIKQINEAYDVLSDSEKRATYDRRHYVYFVPPVEEDPKEVYRREYIIRRQEQDRIQRERETISEAQWDEVRKNVFVFMRWLTMPIALFALILVSDSFLPRTTREEPAMYGWQERTGSRYSHHYNSFMQTSSYSFKVPNEVHIAYDYNINPPLLLIRITPIFKKVKDVSVVIEGRSYAWNTMWSFEAVVQYVLLLSAVYTIRAKSYSRLRYSTCFLALLLFGITLLYLL